MKGIRCISLPILFYLAVLLPALLTGCGVSSGEKQIFPICMSMDRLEDGRLQLAVQVNTMNDGNAAEYAVFAAAGDTFGQTLEILGASMPYPLHFGQLRLCLIGGELAAGEELAMLLAPLGEMYTINRGAAVMITSGRAAEVMAAQKPDLGVRLSTYLDQLLARLRQERLTPSETLGDLLILLGSGYRDPLLGVCAVNPAAGPDESASDGSDRQGGAQGDSKPAFSASGSIAIGEPSPEDDLPRELQAGSLPRKGGNPVEYTGCAAVGAGRAAVLLTASQTRLILTLRDEARISGLTEARARVTLPADAGVQPEEAAKVLGRLQNAGCDVLGLGAAAARRCLTEAEWRQKLPDVRRITLEIVTEE